MASGLAAKITTELGVEPTLEKGVAGVFDIIVNGKTIFSKVAEQRFPQDEEILTLLRDLQG